MELMWIFTTDLEQTGYSSHLSANNPCHNKRVYSASILYCAISFEVPDCPVSAVSYLLSVAEPQREKSCYDYEQSYFHRLNCDRQKLRTSGLQRIGNSIP